MTRAFLRQHYRSVALGVLGTLLLYIYLGPADDDLSVQERAASLSAQEYDYYMNDIDSTSFRPDGQRHWRLQASRLVHYPNPDSSVLENPDLVIYPEDEPPWFISARRGRVSHARGDQSNRIDLMDDVVIRHETEDGRPVSIYTDFLSVYPETEVAETESTVLMQSPGTEIRGTGLRAALREQRLDLYQDVRAQHDPTVFE